MKISKTFTRTISFLEERVKFANAQTHYAEEPFSGPGSYYTSHWTAYKKETNPKQMNANDPGFYYTNHWTK